jgi:mannose-6-phosphate isomerase-like protein (cupin superfamily)
MSERSERGAVERVTFDDLDGTDRPFSGDREPEVVHLHLEAGEDVPAHTHPGRSVVFAVLDGEFDVRLGDDSHRVGVRECLRFDGDCEISPRATEEAPASALVVLAKR